MTSQKKRIVIVGGVAGGASAATRARRLDEHALITMYERDEYVSFANCGLPYFVGGEIAEKDALLVARPEVFERRFDVRVRSGHEVLSIDRQRKVVSVKCRATQEIFEDSYDRLILAPGASPIIPDFPGGPSQDIFTLRNIPDAEKIRERLRELGPIGHRGEPLTAIVIGCGFIGLEMVEQLVRMQIHTTIVELADQVLPLFDPEMGNLLRSDLQRHHVGLELGVSVASLRVQDRRLHGVVLSDGRELAADLAIVGVGVRPMTKLAEQAGLKIGDSGAIAVNHVGQTSDASIYAVGDAAEVIYGPTGKPSRIALAGPANRAGRIAGEHAAMDRATSAMNPVQGTSIVRVFEKTAALTGLTEKAAAKLGIECNSVHIQAGSHASYYPGAWSMVIKLVYQPKTLRVLGAQGVGGDGVDKRIDVIATLLHFGGTVRDLASLDLTYAPPFSSAKDPVHQAAFLAGNVEDALVRLLPPGANLSELQVVDVRNAAEIAQVPVAGVEAAKCIPIDQLRDRIGELDATRPTVTVCASGKRSYVAARILMQRGFGEVWSLSGGTNLRCVVLACSAR